MLVRTAIEKSLAPRAYKSSGSKLLWASEVGSCPRKVMFRILGYKEETEFPLELREKFQWGNIMEDETARALKGVYGEQLTTQLPLKTKYWSGKTDMVIGLESHQPIIIEHKATSDSGIGYIPRESHVAQIVLYGQLFEELHNKKPQLLLVYRTWSHYAELEVIDKGEFVSVGGQLDGAEYQMDVHINVTKMREYLEGCFGLQKLPDYKKEDECFFAGKPSCQFFKQCHSEKKEVTRVAGWGLF